MSNRSMGLSNAQRRNAMGQFSRDNYGMRSRTGAEAEMIDGLYGLMNTAKDEETRMKFQRFIIDLEER